MTKVFLIAITMFWADAMDTPLQDSVEIKWLDGQPLYFMSVEECGKHIDDNFEKLKEYGKSVYPTAHTVKTIYCVEREKFISNNSEV